MPKKLRTEAPRSVAAKAMFSSDRTCCVCRVPGKGVQIHHIDENPSNHSLGNLAVLCFDCHNDTQLRGGFGRKLDAEQIIEYRGDWIERVQKRRDRADEIAASGSIGGTSRGGRKGGTGMPREAPSEGRTKRETTVYKREDPRPRMIRNYLTRLPQIRAEAYAKARSGWDSGVTAKMLQSNYDTIDVMERALARLVSFQPPENRRNLSAADYANTFVAERFAARRAAMQAERGPTEIGTQAQVMIAGSVLADLEDAISGTALRFADAAPQFGFSFAEWQERWNAAGAEVHT